MSPSYSESAGSGNSGARSGAGTGPGGTASTSGPGSGPTVTPPHIRWAENISFLLDDVEGTNLFMKYLELQSLDHYLKFL